MAYRHIQVDTIICDTCGKETHRVLTDESLEKQVYPEYLEWDFYISELQKKGWTFIRYEKGAAGTEDESKNEVIVCSTECRDALIDKLNSEGNKLSSA